MILTLFAHLFASVALAEQPQPFSDLNTILSMQKSGNTIRFTSSGGQKTLNLTNGTWTHKPSTATQTELSQNLDYLQGKGIDSRDLIPSWVPQMSHMGVFPNTATKDTAWILTSEGDEGGQYIQQHLLDISKHRAFLLPANGFFDFTINNNTAFLISPFGISELDLVTGERTEYWTLPVSNDIRGLARQDNDLFYLSSLFGLYKVSPPKNTVTLVPSFIPYIKEGYRFSAIAEHRNRLYILCNRYANYGEYYFGNLTPGTDSLILVYDPKADKIERYVTGIDFADKLKVSDDYIYGWGYHIEGNEGADSSDFGGLFRFDIKCNATETLARIPISTVDLDSLTAVSAIVNDGEAKVTHLKYDSNKKEFTEDRAESFSQQELGEEYSNKLHEIESRYLTDDSHDAKNAIKVLSNMKFTYTTIKFAAPPAKIESFPENTSEEIPSTPRSRRVLVGHKES